MQKNMVEKGLVIAVFFLFVAVSFQPVFAKDTISVSKNKVGIGFLLVWGIIIYHGEEKIGDQMYYNITPINVKWFQIILGLYNPGITFVRINDNPFYLWEGYFTDGFGFIRNRYIFLGDIGMA